MTTIKDSILACVDGSLYTDSVLAQANWASQRINAPVQVLYIQSPSSELPAPKDLSGTLSLGVRSALLEKLTQVDEARGKLDQQKGNLILNHAKEYLAAEGVSRVQTLHRRGSLVETITALEDTTQLIILGKRGEHADFATLHLGSNLERVVRAAHKPVLVAARAFKAINRFVIAYDGGPSTLKAVDYVINNPLLKGLECHLLKIGSDNAANRQTLAEAEAKLKQGGFTVKASLQQGHADDLISAYVKANQMDILVMGAYGHSHIRTLIIGSTTSTMLRSCPIPVLMFR